jgi:hypothetical protein
MLDKKLLEKFSNDQLKEIINEFFTQHIWVDFANELLNHYRIGNVWQFARQFYIEQISENCTKEELIESGWLFDDEGTEEEWVNNND